MNTQNLSASKFRATTIRKQLATTLTRGLLNSLQPVLRERGFKLLHKDIQARRVLRRSFVRVSLRNPRAHCLADVRSSQAEVVADHLCKLSRRVLQHSDDTVANRRFTKNLTAAEPVESTTMMGVSSTSRLWCTYVCRLHMLAAYARASMNLNLVHPVPRFVVDRVRHEDQGLNADEHLQHSADIRDPARSSPRPQQRQAHLPVVVQVGVEPVVTAAFQ